MRRERDRRALRRQIVLLVCGLAMAGGFVVAVGQHYTAVRYGYEGEKLRAERVRLLAERDRLLLELSAAESPVTLEREARRIGMQPARPSQIAAPRGRAEQTPADAAAERDADADGARDHATRKPASGRANLRDGLSLSTDARPRPTPSDARPRPTDARPRSADERGRGEGGGGDARPRIVEAAGKRGR